MDKPQIGIDTFSLQRMRCAERVTFYIGKQLARTQAAEYLSNDDEFWFQFCFIARVCFDKMVASVDHEHNMFTAREHLRSTKRNRSHCLGFPSSLAGFAATVSHIAHRTMKEEEGVRNERF